MERKREHTEFMLWMQEKVKNIYSYQIDAETKKPATDIAGETNV